MGLSQIDSKLLNGGMILALVGLVLWAEPLQAETGQQPESEGGQEIGVETELLRSWPTPVGTSPYTAGFDSTIDGVTVVIMGRGEEESAECVIVVSDESRARAYTYRHNFHPTRCLDAQAHPEGGFFVRGERADRAPEEVTGFTSRIDADGEVLWSLEDQQLLEQSSPPSGPGEFTGVYAGAMGTLAYDVVNDRLLALSLARLVLPGDDRIITQAHILRGDSGQLRVNGRRFGQLQQDMVVDVVARDGRFLVHTLDGNSEAPQFFSYDGQRSITLIEPAGENWSMREIVPPIAYHRERGAFLLWINPAQQIPQVTGFDEENKFIWSQRFATEAEIGGELHDLGRADRLWIGTDLMALRYRNQQLQYFLRFIEPSDGTDLGVVSWEQMTEADALDLVRGEDGRLRILAVDLTQGRVLELGLDLVEAPSAPGGDSDESDSEEEGGCNASGGTPGALWPLVVGLLLLAGQRRRHSCPSLPKWGPGSTV